MMLSASQIASVDGLACAFCCCMQASQDLRASRDSSSNPPEESTEGCLDWWNEEKPRALCVRGPQQILEAILFVGQRERPSIY